MSDHERAAQLRELADGGVMAAETRKVLWAIADELDPPRLAPRMLVWWQDAEGLGDPVLGQLNDYGMIELFGTTDTVRPRSVKWWPARIAGPMQEIVDIPPVSEWGSSTHQFAVDGYELNSPRTRRLLTITRAEAERREAEG